MKKLTCVCLLDIDSMEKITRLRKEFSDEAGSKKMLTYPPHLSLRGDFEIQEENIPLLVADLKERISTQKKISVQTSKLEFYPWRIVSLEVVSTSDLDSLHSHVMDIVQKYRTGWVPLALLENTTDYSEKQQEYIKKFGYQFAYEFFSPHFGLAGNDMSQDVFESIKKKNLNRIETIDITLENIALIDREKDNKVLSEFPLI